MATSTIRPLLLAHALPHIRAHGFTPSALSLASLTLPPPYHYSAPMNPASIQALFGSGREPERALFDEWLADRRRALVAEFKGKPLAAKGDAAAERQRLQEVLEKRLEMNEEIRPWLGDALAMFSLTSAKIPIAQVPIKNPFPILNHSLHIADDALSFASPTRRDLHRSIPLSLLYTATEMHQLTLPLSQPSMPSTSAYLARRLEEYDGLQDQIGTLDHFRQLGWNAIRGSVKSLI